MSDSATHRQVSPTPCNSPNVGPCGSDPRSDASDVPKISLDDNDKPVQLSATFVAQIKEEMATYYTDSDGNPVQTTRTTGALAEEMADNAARNEIADEISHATEHNDKGKAPASIDSNRTRKKIKVRKGKKIDEMRVKAHLINSLIHKAEKNKALICVTLVPARVQNNEPLQELPTETVKDTKDANASEKKIVYVETQELMIALQTISAIIDKHGGKAATSGEYEIESAYRVKDEFTPTDFPNTVEYNETIPVIGGAEFVEMFIGDILAATMKVIADFEPTPESGVGSVA